MPPFTSTTPATLVSAPLLTLYRHLVDGTAPAEAVFQAIEERAALASDQYALVAAEMPQHALDDYAERLAAALEPNLNLDPAVDAVEREVARVQLETIEHELARRVEVTERVRSGQAYAPPRTEILAALMGLGRQFEVDAETAHFRHTIQRIIALINRAKLNCQPGTPQVAYLLREVTRLPVEEPAHELDPWMRWALVLELLGKPKHGFGGTTVDADPITAAQAVRAQRLLYATTRQDARYDEPDWPLDLTGLEIADLLERHERAAATWARLGIPEADRVRYLQPSRREELGRPEPALQVVPEAEARRLAEAAKGIPIPLIYFVNPRERATAAREIWERGLTEIPRNQIGIPLYSAAGHPEVNWGTPFSSYGVMCTVALPENFILRLGRRDAAADEQIFNHLTDQATAMAMHEDEYARILRQLLLSRGYKAVARWDHTSTEVLYPQEVVVLDPRPPILSIIRESVPSFMHGERPLTIPRPAPRPTTVASHVAR